MTYRTGQYDSDSVSPGSNPGSPANKIKHLHIRTAGQAGTFGLHSTHETRHIDFWDAAALTCCWPPDADEKENVKWR